jgi:hypothetical protein
MREGLKRILDECDDMRVTGEADRGEKAVTLAERVDPQYRPVWEGRPPEQQAALALYFLPHHSAIEADL